MARVGKTGQITTLPLRYWTESGAQKDADRVNEAARKITGLSRLVEETPYRAWPIHELAALGVWTG